MIHRWILLMYWFVQAWIMQITKTTAKVGKTIYHIWNYGSNDRIKNLHKKCCHKCLCVLKHNTWTFVPVLFVVCGWVRILFTPRHRPCSHVMQTEVTAISCIQPSSLSVSEMETLCFACNISVCAVKRPGITVGYYVHTWLDSVTDKKSLAQVFSGQKICDCATGDNWNIWLMWIGGCGAM